MNFRFLFGNPLLAVTVFTYAAGAAYADTLVLTSQTGGQYDYGLQLDANHGLVINVGDEIMLTGLSGVIGASVLPGLSFAYSNVVTTSTSVTITDTTGFVLDPLTVSHIISAVQVTSSVSTTGSVIYQVQTASEGTLSGVVPGPVAVPEPVELPALAAIAVFLGAALRKHNCGRG